MSPELFGQLSSEYRELLYLSAVRKMRNKEDAEDVVQSTMLNAFRFKDSFRYESTFGSWLYRIMLHELGMFYRSRRCGKWNISLEHQLASAEVEMLYGDYRLRPDVLFSNKEIRERFEQVLDILPPKQKDVALLKFGLGMTMKEMSKILNRTELGVKASLHQARVKLRIEMAEMRV